MEARIARLEADVAHLRTDVAEIKVDLRTMRDRMDARFERLETKFDAKLDTLHTEVQRGDAESRHNFAALREADGSLRTEIASAKIWALLLYFALAATLLGTLARGFGWV